MKIRKILIIDDDKFLLDMYTLKFKEEGYDVIGVSGGLEALEKLEKGLKPNAILLDIVMPMMDGFEFLQKIKKEKTADDAKIIILSNLGQQSDIEKGEQLGADDYIVKASMTPSEVVEKVFKCI